MAARGPRGGGASRRKREPSFKRNDDEDEDDGALRPSPRDRAARAEYGRPRQSRGGRKRAAASRGASSARGSALAFLFRYSSLAALVAALLTPLVPLSMGRTDYALLFAAMSVIVFVMHRANISRLLSRTEPRIGAGR